MPGCPRGLERLGRLATAQETGTMSGGKRRRFVEKEQLRPASRRHHRASDTFVVAPARNPGFRSPALPQKLLCRGVVDDAPVAGESASLGDSHDLPKRRDPVL